MHIVHTVVLFAIVLGIMVLIHELGHFVMAKLCKVKVEIFSLGFGPRIAGFRYGDTDYRISALPLGGYVKMFGDAPGEAPRDRETLDVLGIDIDSSGEFNGRPRWQRVLIALSGPFANFILSFFLLFFVAHYHHEVDRYLTGAAVVDYVPVNSPVAHAGVTAGDTITRFGNDINPTWDEISKDAALNVNHSLSLTFVHNGQSNTHDITILSGDNTNQPGPDMLIATGLIPRESEDSLIVNDVNPGSPGERAGLKPGDHIVSINGLAVHSLDPVIAYLQDSNGAPATIHVLRDNQPITLQLTPEKGDNGLGVIKWLIGFRPKHVPIDVQHLSIGQSFIQSAKDNYDSSTLVLKIIRGLFTRHVSVKAMSGPVGIAQQVEIASQQGIWPLIEFVALISLQLGIFNLLPFPPLDGGMILFLLIESVIRRDVNQAVKERVYQVAIVCVMCFFVFVLFNDITRLHLGR
jgi:regulator of sigma E protease